MLTQDRTYTICGSLEFMAPEMLGRQGYGIAVDWWALGIVIYELYTKQTPFDADSL